MKYTFLAILLFFFACTTAQASEFDPYQGPKPIAVLIQSDPWLDCVGADTPSVAIYEDGQVIYQLGKTRNSSKYMTKKLTTEELAVVRKKLTSFGDYSAVKRFYNLMPYVTDQPTTQIYLLLEDGSEFDTCIYGLIASGTTTASSSSSNSNQNPDGLPVLIKDLHRYLTSLSYADATQWTPAYMEVVVWGYEYAPGVSIQWPKEWPGLDSPNTKSRDGMYKIYLPGNQQPELEKFLKTQKPKGAIEIEGKKWSAFSRYVFPNEPIWHKAFSREEEPEVKATDIATDDGENELVQ